METIKIPIGIYIIIKSITWIMVAATLSVLTTYQFRSWFYQKSPVTLPIFFVMETLPDPQCQPMHEEQKPLRKHSFLQANFSLINQYDDILKIPVEYEIEVKLVVPDYEIRGFHPYDEGMFLTCLRLIDREENTVWPLVNPWNAEVPMIRNSRCRSSILLKQSLMQTIFERLWSIWHLRLTSSQYWQRTQDIVTLIEESFEVDVNKKPSRGIVTLLSYNLQVVKSHVRFTPKISWFTMYPKVSAVFMFNVFFSFWFVILSFIRILQI